MRNFRTISLTLLGLLLIASTPSKAETYNSIKEAKGQSGILDDPKIAQLYTNCKEELKSDFPSNEDSYEETYTTALEKCLWGKIQDEKLEDKLLDEKYLSKSAAPVTVSTSNPAVKKLGEYFSKRLEESLYGDTIEGTTKVVDHQVFTELYKNMTSKAVITSMTSYCMEADPSDNYNLHKSVSKRRKAREDAIIALGKKEDDPGDNKDPNMSKGFNQWNECIARIPKICSTSTDTDSKKRACLISSYVKGLRKNLIAIAASEKRMEEIANGGTAFIAENIQVYQGDEPGKTIDDLTSLSSNEAVNESEYADENEKIASELNEQCIEGAQGNPQAVKACARYLNNEEKTDRLTRMKDELIVRKMLQEKKVKKLAGEELKEYLKKEGRSDEEIEKILAGGEGEIKDQIEKQFKAEKDALIASINDTIKDTRTSDKDGNDKVVKNIGELKENFDRKAEDFKQLVHFSNIVSGYLDLNDGSGKSLGKNLRSLEREFADSAFAPGRNTAGQGQNNNQGYEDYRARKERYEQDSGRYNQAPTGSSSIGVDQINDIYKYEYDN